MRMQRWVWNIVINGLVASSWFPERVKPIVMRLLGAQVDSTVRIRRRVDIYGPALTIKPGCFINASTQIQNFEHVSIGTNVFIGPRVTILTVSHELGPSHQRAMKLIAKPVTIGNGSWIASSATILPGVSVKEGCVVAAGAVVTHDCEPRGLYAGVPAIRVKDLP